MRGKTNATNGVHLNATAVNKTVKSGQIVAGDFVEYYTEPNIVPQSAANTFINTVGSYTVTQKGTGLALFKNAEQVHEFTDYNILCACAYDDFVIFFSSTNVVGVVEIDITNDELSLVDTITASIYDAAYDDAYTIGAGDGMVLACTQYKYNSTNDIRYRFALIDISVTGELSNCTITSYIKGGNYFNLKIDNYDNGNFRFFGNYPSSSLISIELLIDQDRLISWGDSNTVQTYYFFGDKMYQHDEIVVYAGYSSYSYVPRVFCDNLTNGAGNTMAIVGDPVTNIENGKFITCEEISSSSYCLRLYAFNEATSDVTLLDSITPTTQPYPVNTTNGKLTGFINGNDVLVKAKGGSNLRRFRINGNYLQEIPEVDYVVPYSGTGDPIGVAQTDGNVNDVIPVYIPTYTP